MTARAETATGRGSKKVHIEKRTDETELAHRLNQYEQVLARHAQLLEEINQLSQSEDLSASADPITRGPNIEQRRAAARRILPVLIANPSPLNIHTKEPIPHPKFGNPLRWCLSNIETVIPKETINLMQLVDRIYLAYDVIYGSFDVRSIMERQRTSLAKRERIGGTNDYLSIWEEVKEDIDVPYLSELSGELCWAAKFHRKGIQAAISGMPIIGHSDFLEELQKVAGYVRNQTNQWGGYEKLSVDTTLTREEVKAIFETISIIGEHEMARKALEDNGLKNLTSGGFRISADLVSDFWHVRT